MKSVLLLIFLFPFVSFGQKLLFKSENPAGDANIVLIETSTDDSEVYKAAGRILIKSGYTVDRSNEDFQSISTKPENRENYGFPTNITVSVLDHKVVIRGFYYNRNRRHSGFFKRNGLKSLVAFRLMDEYAKELKTAIQVDVFEYGVEKTL